MIVLEFIWGHCATSLKVMGLIPNGVSGIFYWHNPSGHAMALGSTQPLTETSTRYISWGGVRVAGAYGWQPYHLHVPTVLKYGSLNLLEPSGPVQDCMGVALPLLEFIWLYLLTGMGPSFEICILRTQA